VEKKLLIRVVVRNPRLSIALPDGLLRALERWAEAEGNKPTSLATFLLEKAIREAIEEGKIPPESLETKDSKLVPANLKAFLTQLASGELPTNGQLITLAHDLGVDTEVLMELRDRVRRGNANKKEGQTNGT
jgi:CopG-like RHH_1 or ribbon-helix-helix domain, RHH_5